MAHFAEIDSNNTVKRVIVVSDTDAVSGQDFCSKTLGLGGTWIQCSYNSKHGKHHTLVPVLSGTETISWTLSADNKPHMRYNYPSPGHKYDSTRDAFIAPKQYPSWILNESTCDWEPPVPRPPLSAGLFRWKESEENWSLIVPGSALNYMTDLAIAPALLREYMATNSIPYSALG